MKKNGRIKKFHQFVKVEKGPVNTAVIDLLMGSVFHVENRVITALEEGRYDDIPEFMQAAGQEGLILDVDEKTWLPPCGENPEIDVIDIFDKDLDIELHVEEGVNLEAVLEKLKNHTIYRIVFYGKELPQISGLKVKIVKKEKNFSHCVERVRITGEFDQVTEPGYKFSKKYNSCWGEKVAVTRDGKVRPCIYSHIVVGDIAADNMDEMLEKLDKYWTITKDKVEKCKDCELRLICFDCREIAYRKSGDLYSAQPGCNYDPYKGTWTG